MAESLTSVEGINGQVQLLDDRIVIQRKGLRASALRGLKEGEIRLSQIVSIQFKAAGLLGGSINFTCPTMGIGVPYMVTFNKEQQPAFERLKSTVEERMAAAKQARQAQVFSEVGQPETALSRSHEETTAIMEAEGTTGQVKLLRDELVIRREGYGTLFMNLKGAKIPLDYVGSVFLKPAGTFSRGHIQFVYLDQEPKTRLIEISHDENTVEFTKIQQPDFELLKSAVERRISSNQGEIEKLMALLRDGTILIRFAIEGGKSELVLKQDEELQMLMPNMELWEARSVRNSTGSYGGVSFRVAKGVTLHTGSFGAQSSSDDELKEIDQGRLTLTNQRLVFTGAKRTSEIGLSKIVSIEPYRDGIAVQASGRTKTQCFVGIDPTRITVTATHDERNYTLPFTGSVLECMIEGLIKKQQEARSQPSSRESGKGTASAADIPEQIRQLSKLRDEGIITSEEFEKKKAELLERM